MSYTSGYGDARTAGLASGYGLGGPLSPRTSRYGQQAGTRYIPPTRTVTYTQEEETLPRIARYGNQDNVTTSTTVYQQWDQQSGYTSPRGTRYNQQSGYTSPRGSRYTQQAALTGPRGTLYGQQSGYTSPRGTRYTTQQAGYVSPRGTRYGQQSSTIGYYGQATR